MWKNEPLMGGGGGGIYHSSIRYPIVVTVPTFVSMQPSFTSNVTVVHVPCKRTLLHNRAEIGNRHSLEFTTVLCKPIAILFKISLNVYLSLWPLICVYLQEKGKDLTE